MKITVAVAINEDGEWYAWGGSSWTKQAGQSPLVPF